ncbi:FAD binding domain protein [Annulohypoxylon nitens]|nr:FAD binding domain protein [Annulohypoxylon nitens]
MFSFSQVCLVALPLLTLFPPSLAERPNSNCRCISGDACWPKQSEWSELNATVHGRLIATTPLASVCHGSAYNKTACDHLAETWTLPEAHFPYPAEIMDPYWQNQSCDPFTPRSNACDLGNYVDFTVNVSSASDVVAGLQFAQKHNVRIVIKNTGHDYLGKSTGKGALGLWTHNLKSISFLNFSSSAYTGPAVKMGAGVQAFELYQKASDVGLRVVGGACATVGLAGGFLQGGGHSTLSSTYGMATDQILEWEVISANGTHLIASPFQNEDLYWALSGGGGGTYGVVISATVKAFKDGVVGGAFLSFNKTGIPDEKFWKGVEEFHSALPAIVDSGATVLYSLVNDSFTVVPLTAPGKTQQQVSALLQPFLSKMKDLTVPVTSTVTSYPTFLEHFNEYLGPLPYGRPELNPINVSIGGRLIPRHIVENSTSNTGLIEALKLSVHPGGDYITGGIAFNVGHGVVGKNLSSNAVLPAWRDSILTLLTFAPWDFNGTRNANLAADEYLLKDTIPALTALAPEGGAYLNEANLQQPDWQKTFYGANYAKLKSIKKVYDPLDLFFANTGVGSEAWAPDGDGRLCRSK